jgi:AraC-like DNA-binding protein
MCSARIGFPSVRFERGGRARSRTARRAQELLARGIPQAEVAASVGLYDQSQLHRHFKRILGVTPGAFARAAR